ncbi:MAG: hypothetical protein ACYCWE_17135 [Eubacteriales bacterium]
MLCLRILVFICLLAIVTQTVSCAGSKTDKNIAATHEYTDVSEAAETEDVNGLSFYEQLMLPIEDNLPERDFEGAELNILSPSDVHWAQLIVMDMEQSDGEVLNDAIYGRTLAVEEQYNADVRDIFVNYANVASAMKKSVMAGDRAYDAGYSVMITFTQTLATQGMLYDLYELPYLDLEKSYWNQNAKVAFTISDKLYYIVGDANMFYNDSTWVIMFNKQVAEDFNIPDLYEMVKTGTWTYDVMFDMCKTATNDIDGDGEITVNDSYGLIINTHGIASMMFGSGESAVKKEGDGTYTYNLTEKYLDIINKVNTIYNEGNVTIDVYNSKGLVDDDIGEALGKNTALFAGEVLQCVRRYRAVDSNFGVIPAPKYDESQPHYNSFSIFPYCTPLFVPVDLGDDEAEMTGILLEALASKSREILIPAYFRSSLEYKFLRDDESGEMMKIIFENRYFPMEGVMDLGILSAIDSCMKGNKGDFTSALAKAEKTVTKKLNELPVLYAGN